MQPALFEPPMLIKPAEKIRTLGFYQPFGSLMLHGKIETRWVRQGKKPPFPLGKYLFYTTKQECPYSTLIRWCGEPMMQVIHDTLFYDGTKDMNGMAIGIGDLAQVRHLERGDEEKAFVKYVGAKSEEIRVLKQQWALIFENVHRIEPFEWKHGKQGVGFVPDHLISLIKPI